MTEDSLPTRRILDAAEVILRRHGAEKTNVVDIARSLGMSHANIYRHFPSKKALLDAVAARWLHATTEPLEWIARDQARSAAERLAAWFDTLRTGKRRKVLDEPELFRVYHDIVEKAHEVVTEHIGTLLGQLERILADGVRTGEFPGTLKAKNAAETFFRATVQFHHPALVMQEPAPTEAAAQDLFRLLLAGLRAEAARES